MKLNSILLNELFVFDVDLEEKKLENNELTLNFRESIALPMQNDLLDNAFEEDSPKKSVLTPIIEQNLARNKNINEKLCNSPIKSLINLELIRKNYKNKLSIFRNKF